MRYYVGAVCLLLGIWLIYSAVTHRKLVISARERAAANGREQEVDPGLAAMGTAMLPFYALYGGFASLLAIGGFFLSDLSQYVSIVDLLGVLVLIAGYCVWMIIRAAYSKLGLDLSSA